MLQWNSPRPTRCLSGRSGIGRELSRTIARHCECAITRQPVTPALPRSLKLRAEKQRAKTRTVDEEIASDPQSGSECDRIEVARVRTLRDVLHLPFDSPHATLGRPATQEVGIESGVEVIGIRIG